MAHTLDDTINSVAKKKQPKVVLLVEDDILISDILARKFSQSGVRVYQALSGKRAFEFLKEITPDAILLDLILPEMGGFEILESLKKNSKLSKIPVIILSNSSEPADIEKAKSLGALDYFVKIDVPLEDVVARLNSICGA